MNTQIFSPRRHKDTKGTGKIFWKTKSLFIVLSAFVSSWFMISPVWAYPDFQAFIKKNSGRSVDCAFCHVNSNGPEGNGPGQLGSLTPEEFDRLNFARGAFDPGRNVNSPILNAFGNRIIHELGKKKFLEIKNNPVGLAKALDPKVDLDGDGIPDVQEFLDGTHPLKNTDGNPWWLFWANFQKNRMHIFLLFFATLFGLYGLNNLLGGFARLFEGDEEEGP